MFKRDQLHIVDGMWIHIVIQNKIEGYLKLLKKNKNIVSNIYNFRIYVERKLDRYANAIFVFLFFTIGKILNKPGSHQQLNV